MSLTLERPSESRACRSKQESCMQVLANTRMVCRVASQITAGALAMSLEQSVTKIRFQVVEIGKSWQVVQI
eukprot:6198366-Pleurochrysis_carterae.AAC.2